MTDDMACFSYLEPRARRPALALALVLVCGCAPVQGGSESTDADSDSGGTSDSQGADTSGAGTDDVELAECAPSEGAVAPVSIEWFPGTDPYEGASEEADSVSVTLSCVVAELSPGPGLLELGLDCDYDVDPVVRRQTMRVMTTPETELALEVGADVTLAHSGWYGFEVGGASSTRLLEQDEVVVLVASASLIQEPAFAEFSTNMLPFAVSAVATDCSGERDAFDVSLGGATARVQDGTHADLESTPRFRLFGNSLGCSQCSDAAFSVTAVRIP